MATFKLPFNDRLTVRFFERVETTDPQYDIVDCGVEYNDGSRDTIAVGGAFTSLKKWTAPKSKEEKLARRKAKRRAKRKATPSESTEVDTTSDE